MAPDTAAPDAHRAAIDAIRQLGEMQRTVAVSDYAMQHPEHYGLRATTWYGGKVVNVHLTLMDANGDFIDEDGCNCDLDSPCNNPQCVMERRPWG